MDVVGQSTSFDVDATGVRRCLIIANGSNGRWKPRDDRHRFPIGSMTSPKEKSAMKNESRWPATAAASVSRPAAGTASRRPTAMTDDFGQKLREKGRRRAADWADKDLMRPLQCPFVDRTVDRTIPASPQVFLKFSSSKLVGFFFFRYGHFLVAMGALTRSKKKRTGKNKLLATIWNGTLIMKDREREREREKKSVHRQNDDTNLFTCEYGKTFIFFLNCCFIFCGPPVQPGSTSNWSVLVSEVRRIVSAMMRRGHRIGPLCHPPAVRSFVVVSFLLLASWKWVPVL